MYSIKLHLEKSNTWIKLYCIITNPNPKASPKMKPPTFITFFLIKTQIKSIILADKYKSQRHKFMRREFKICFLNANTFTLFEAHMLFCNNAWIIVFTLIDYYLNIFLELLVSKRSRIQITVKSFTK